MKNTLIELNNGTMAIVHKHEEESCSQINATIGFLRPGMRCLEYIHVKDCVPECKGINDAVNGWLKKIYQQNLTTIQQHIKC